MTILLQPDNCQNYKLDITILLQPDNYPLPQASIFECRHVVSWVKYYLYDNMKYYLHNRRDQLYCNSLLPESSSD